MSEKPILFSTPMVQALLNTKPNTRPPEPIDASKPCKGMTRRVIKPQPNEGDIPFIDIPPNLGQGIHHFVQVSPKYQIGQILWVRETWAYSDGHELPQGYYYKANSKDAIIVSRWKPSIFMTRKAARLFLKVRDVRVERLQDISEKDAKMESLGIARCNYTSCVNAISGGFNRQVQHPPNRQKPL